MKASNKNHEKINFILRLGHFFLPTFSPKVLFYHAHIKTARWTFSPCLPIYYQQQRTDKKSLLVIKLERFKTK